MISTNDHIDVGSGTAVIFSHGTMMDYTMFNHQIDAVQGGYRAIAYNHRAATSRYAEIYGLDDLARDCLNLADEKDLDKVVLVGMSMGGFMGLEFALNYQDRLLGLVLIDTMARAYTPTQQVEFGSYFDKLDTDGPLPRDFGEWCVPLVWSPTAIKGQPDLVQHWLERWDRRPARSVWGEYNSWIRKSDLTPRLGEITVPTLVIHGEDDQVLPLDTCGEPLAAGIPNARLAVIPTAGHTSNEEQPDAVNRELLSFLSSLPT